MKAIGLALVAVLVCVMSAQGREYDRHDYRGFGAEQLQPMKVHAVKVAKRHPPKRKVKKRQAPYQSSVAQIVSHPPGCPPRAFCGCGVSLHIFGKAVRAGGLAIAANWLAFTRAEPAPGMVAARKGHVFAILENLGSGRVLAYDPNSGGHKTRIHVRSLRGYTVVNPRSRYASAE